MHQGRPCWRSRGKNLFCNSLKWGKNIPVLPPSPPPPSSSMPSSMGLFFPFAPAFLPLPHLPLPLSSADMEGEGIQSCSWPTPARLHVESDLAGANSSSRWVRIPCMPVPRLVGKTRGTWKEGTCLLLLSLAEPSSAWSLPGLGGCFLRQLEAAKAVRKVG